MSTERGAASILIELSDGKISIKHGEDGDILFSGNEVAEGTWLKIFSTVKKIISKNKANPQPITEG